MIKKLLLVGDCHASPDTDNRRFDFLGRMILEEAPEVIIQIGDMADLNSLSSYDKGKRSAELRRYRNDIASTQDALERINGPLKSFNSRRKNVRKAQRILPRKILTLGNHEDRIRRAVNMAPEMEGTISIEDLQYPKYGWEVIPYKQPFELEGVWFNHFFPSGIKGEAISGYSIASNVIQKNMVSSVCGHSHLWDHAIRSKPNGMKVIGLCCGCYLEEPTYDDATGNLWWSGLTMLHDVHDGVFDITQYGIERVKGLYGT